MNLYELWEYMQDLFSWESVQKLYPEGKGIYELVIIDLSVAHTNKIYSFNGSHIIVTHCDNPATLRLNNEENDEIPVNVVPQINTPFKEFYITNTASSGTLELLCGTRGFFNCSSSLRIMSGKFGSQFIPIAVDVDGNMIGVFKGDYGGILKTLATDSEGRLLAIITDPEDVYGNAHQLGNAELAARLNSLHSYDRRGNVVFMDSFQDHINSWKQTTSGAGGAIALSTDRIYKGVSSAKLTAGSDVSNYAQLERYFPLSKNTKLGFELIFSLGANVDNVTMHITIYDGTWKRQCMIRLDVDNEKLQYRIPSDPADVSGGSYGIYEDYHLFYKMKMVIDRSTNEYVRFLFNEQEYDLSAIGLRSDSDASDPYIHVRIENDGDVGSNGVLYIGGFILTQNE